MLDEIQDWLSKPFTTDIPMKQMLLTFVLFVVIAVLAIDVLNVLKEGLTNG